MLMLNNLNGNGSGKTINLQQIFCYMNEQSRFAITVGNHEFSLSTEQLQAIDMVQQAPGELNIIHQHRSVNSKLLKVENGGKRLSIEVDGQRFTVQIKTPLDQMLDQMGFSKAVTKQVKEIKAPMPGLVLEVAVQEGEQVQEGSKLLILGAMKMENSILIPTEATIKKVCVAVGDAVEKGQVLIELE